MSQKASSKVILNKEQRFSQQQEQRRLKREAQLLKRRGLDFVTDACAEDMDEDEIEVLEQEVDNVAPKVIALLGLSDHSDVAALRQQMIDQCKKHEANIKGSSHQGNNPNAGEDDIEFSVNPKESEDMQQEEEESKFDSQFRAYMCPNPGSNANMGSKKQRMIFLEMNRHDPHSILDIGKVADIIVVAMSCKKSNLQDVKLDPYSSSNAIDEVGYKSLSLLKQ